MAGRRFRAGAQVEEGGGEEVLAHGAEVLPGQGAGGAAGGEGARAEPAAHRVLLRQGDQELLEQRGEAGGVQAEHDTGGEAQEGAGPAAELHRRPDGEVLAAAGRGHEQAGRRAAVQQQVVEIGVAGAERRRVRAGDAERRGRRGDDSAGGGGRRARRTVGGDCGAAARVADGAGRFARGRFTEAVFAESRQHTAERVRRFGLGEGVEEEQVRRGR